MTQAPAGPAFGTAWTGAGEKHPALPLTFGLTLADSWASHATENIVSPPQGRPRGRGRPQLTVAVLVFSAATAAAAAVAAAAVVPLEPGLPVPADAAHNDGDAREDDDHTYDCARHQHGRHEKMAVL
ncbi:Transforming Growth Factor-Beta-Induced Protein Ig-H3 [Manis pentadactyla]|nr:Transforming Growth Factor-Beta-Induced Protein Ig-H3 [Manis pentadactyla]